MCCSARSSPFRVRSSRRRGTEYFVNLQLLAQHPLVKSLGVPLCALFSRISARDKDKVADRQSETHRPPNGGEGQRVPARSDGVGSQRILRRKSGIEHHRENSSASGSQ